MELRGPYKWLYTWVTVLTPIIGVITLLISVFLVPWTKHSPSKSDKNSLCYSHSKCIFHINLSISQHLSASPTKATSLFGKFPSETKTLARFARMLRFVRVLRLLRLFKGLWYLVEGIPRNFRKMVSQTPNHDYGRTPSFPRMRGQG